MTVTRHTTTTLHSILSAYRSIPEQSPVQLLRDPLRKRRHIPLRLPTRTQRIERAHPSVPTATTIPSNTQGASRPSPPASATTPSTTPPTPTLTPSPAPLHHPPLRHAHCRPIRPMQLPLMQVPLLLFLLVPILGRVAERVPCEDLAFEAFGSAAGLHGEERVVRGEGGRGGGQREVAVADGRGRVVEAGGAEVGEFGGEGGGEVVLSGGGHGGGGGVVVLWCCLGWCGLGKIRGDAESAWADNVLVGAVTIRSGRLNAVGS